MATDRPPLKDIVHEYLNPSHAVSLMKYRMRKGTSKKGECSKVDFLKEYRKSEFNPSLKEVLRTESGNGTFTTHECQIDEIEQRTLVTLEGTITDGRISFVETKTPVPPPSVFLEHMNMDEQRVYKTYYDITGATPLCYKSHTWEGDVMVVTFGSATFNLLGDEPLWNDAEEVHRIDANNPATHLHLGDRTVMAAFIEHFDPDTSPSVSSSESSSPPTVINENVSESSIPNTTVGGKSPRPSAALSASYPTVGGKCPRPSVSFSDDVQTHRCGKAPVPGFEAYDTEAIEDDGSEEDESDVEEDESEAMEEDETVGSSTRPQTGVKSPVVMGRLKRSYEEEKKDPTWSPDDDNEEEVRSPLPRYKRTFRGRKRKRDVPRRQLKSLHGRKKVACEDSCSCSKCTM